MHAKQTRLTITQILAWADAHHRRRGKWPSSISGPVFGGSGTTWSQIDSGLRRGFKGLPGGSSLAQLLAEKRGKRNPKGLPRLTIKQVLQWADAHYERTGQWPRQKTGRVRGASGDNWLMLDTSLRRGMRGLRGGSSLAKLLAKHRGVRNRMDLPPLSIEQILAWADAHRARTGDWPTTPSGRVHEAPGEDWAMIDHALQFGRRRLPHGWRLTRFLAKHRNQPYQRKGPHITEEQILAWARQHRKRTGFWPGLKSGHLPGARGETWRRVDMSLRKGSRGLAGGSSLSRLLAKHYGVPIGSQRRKRPTTPGRRFSKPRGARLTTKQILAWARSHHQRSGQWPIAASGEVRGGRGETWRRIDDALGRGMRGLPGGSSLAKLLAKRCGKRHRLHLPTLTLKQILTWADAHHRRTGNWPSRDSGPVLGVPGENWSKLDDALLRGRRGLSGGSPLRKHLAIHRGRPYKQWGSPLIERQIIGWARAHHQRTGQWPHTLSGPVHGVPNEHWRKISLALALGHRGLPGGSSLTKLLAKHCGVRDARNPPALSVKQILAWADAHYRRSGDWPSRHSGRLEEDPQETWSAINAALANGTRGLRGRSSLVKILSKHRKALYQRKGLPLKRGQILDWAAAHHELTGKLPAKKSGPVRDIPGETWAAIDASLRVGSRTLPRGSSLAELLNRHYTPAYQGVGQRLTTGKILKWADDFRRRLDRWPTKKSAYVDPSRGEKWSTIDLALREGHRGLTAGSSLHRLLREKRSNP